MMFLGRRAKLILVLILLFIGDHLVRRFEYWALFGRVTIRVHDGGRLQWTSATEQ